MKIEKFLAFFKINASKINARSTRAPLKRSTLDTLPEKRTNKTAPHAQRNEVRHFTENEPQKYSISSVTITHSGVGIKIQFEVKSEKFTSVYIRLSNTSIPLKCNKHNEPYHLPLKMAGNQLIQIISNDEYDILSSLKFLYPVHLSRDLLERVGKHFPAQQGTVDLYNYIAPPPSDQAPEPPATPAPIPHENNFSGFFVVPPVIQAPEPPANWLKNQ